jgi:amidase
MKLLWHQSPFERFTRELAEFGMGQTHADLWLAWNELQKAGYVLADFLTDYDLLLTPVLGEPPLKTGELEPLPSLAKLKERAFEYVGYTPIGNTSGFPAMSVPLYWNGDGLPIGVQFIARFGDESTLFSLAAQLERAQPWFSRRPAAGSSEG